MDSVEYTDIYDAWYDADELVVSLSELTDDELASCRQALIKRAEDIRKSLGKYVEEEVA